MGALNLDLFLDELAARVATKLQAVPSQVKIDGPWVDQSMLPKALRTAYLNAANRGDLPTSRLGNAVVSTRKDFESWLSSGKKGPKSALQKLAKSKSSSQATNDDDDIRAAFGLKKGAV